MKLLTDSFQCTRAAYREKRNSSYIGLKRLVRLSNRVRLDEWGWSQPTRFGEEPTAEYSSTLSQTVVFLKHGATSLGLSTVQLCASPSFALGMAMTFLISTAA